MLAKRGQPLFVPDSKKANFDATHELEELLLEENPLKARKRKPNQDVALMSTDMRMMEEQCVLPRRPDEVPLFLLRLTRVCSTLPPLQLPRLRLQAAAATDVLPRFDRAGDHKHDADDLRCDGFDPARCDADDVRVYCCPRRCRRCERRGGRDGSQGRADRDADGATRQPNGCPCRGDDCRWRGHGPES